MEKPLTADVVIVGGGTAGSVLAAKLSAAPDRTVVLLEAGPVELPQMQTLLHAETIPGARGESSWRFAGSLAAGREWTHVRGKVIGGSSTTNGGYFIAAGPRDVNEWATVGGGPWSWENLRPLQIGIERDLDYPQSPAHGHDGPVTIERARADDPSIEAFHSAAVAMGLEGDLDKGADWSDGFGVTPSNRHDEIRSNAALAYLLPAAKKSNLRIVGNAVVLRVDISRGRATGVHALIDGELTRVAAGQVILAAGALRSPDLLGLSGVRHPRLGRDLHDEPQLILEIDGWPDSTERRTWLGGVVHATLADGGSVEILQSLRPLHYIIGQPPEPSTPVPLFVSVDSAAEPGQLTRTSEDPMQLPRVEFDYLATSAARTRLRHAVRFAAELACAGGGTVLRLDTTTLSDDSQLDSWIRANLGTAFHTTGGAAIGDVVDGAGYVLDIENLRVADLSILPSSPRRGPAATAFLVGELLSRS
ncbi:GMC family oxidoreductase N-terminal domain-containing protein [Microbacterium sp. X-17]|uniref:GMC family oxidoreductase n=1 Tax=Microbacterium sp. X-17 TaxID=3144404 RepID=UPI0031F4C213